MFINLFFCKMFINPFFCVFPSFPEILGVRLGAKIFVFSVLFCPFVRKLGSVADHQPPPPCHITLSHGHCARQLPPTDAVLWLISHAAWGQTNCEASTWQWCVLLRWEDSPCDWTQARDTALLMPMFCSMKISVKFLPTCY